MFLVLQSRNYTVYVTIHDSETVKRTMICTSKLELIPKHLISPSPELIHSTDINEKFENFIETLICIIASTS